MRIYNVCWSGGVDSTFIITQLSRFPVTIRPFYIKGQTYRLSEPQELAAIDAIRKLLVTDSRTNAELLPLEIIEKDDPRIKDREIIKASRNIQIELLKEYKIKHGGKMLPAGSQQIYVEKAYFPPQNVSFASLAKNIGEPIEMGSLCTEFDCHPAFQFLTNSVTDDFTKRKLLCLDKNNPNSNFNLIYENILFPIAGQGMYKADVWQWYETHGYPHIRDKTIFCQDPVLHGDGSWEPCGVCTACIGVIDENIMDPFTEEGLARYRDYEANHEKEPNRFRLKGF